MKISIPNDNGRISFFKRYSIVVAFVSGIFLALLLGGSFLLIPNPLAEVLNQPILAPPHVFEGKCTRIIDGDTVIISMYRGDYIVNLVSINAPDEGEKHCDQATQFTTKLLLNQMVTVQPTHGVSYEEIDAWIYAGPRCFNNELVKLGYARYSLGQLDDSSVKILEAEARKSKRGFWRDPDFKVRTH